MSFYTSWGGGGSSTSLRNPKLMCGNERSRPWRCESCLGIPSQLHFGIIKRAVPMSWWFSEWLCKSCRGRAPGPPRKREVRIDGQNLVWLSRSVNKHGDTGSDGLVLQFLPGIPFSSLGWGIRPCALLPRQLTCRRLDKLLPRSWVSGPTVETLYCTWAKFIFRELLILTILTECLSCSRTDFSCKGQETPCKGRHNLLLQKKLP